MSRIVSQLTLARALDAIISRGVAAQRDLIADLDRMHKTTVSLSTRILHERGLIERVTDPETIRASVAIKCGPRRAWRATAAGKAAALGDYNPSTATCLPCGKAPRPTRGAAPEPQERATVEAVEADIYDVLIDAPPLTADELLGAVKRYRADARLPTPRSTVVELARVKMQRRGELATIEPGNPDYPAESTQPHRVTYTLARTKPATQPQEATP